MAMRIHYNKGYMDTHTHKKKGLLTYVCDTCMRTRGRTRTHTLVSQHMKHMMYTAMNRYKLTSISAKSLVHFRLVSVHVCVVY